MQIPSKDTRQPTRFVSFVVLRKWKKIYRRKRVFERKIKNFSYKNTLPPRKLLPARLSSEAMSAYRATKPKAWETVRKCLAIIYEHILIF